MGMMGSIGTCDWCGKQLRTHTNGKGGTTIVREGHGDFCSNKCSKTCKKSQIVEREFREKERNQSSGKNIEISEEFCWLFKTDYGLRINWDWDLVFYYG